VGDGRGRRGLGIDEEIGAAHGLDFEQADRHLDIEISVKRREVDEERIEELRFILQE
jgi:ribosomal protein L13E